jgi:hypothetical protein
LTIKEKEQALKAVPENANEDLVSPTGGMNYGSPITTDRHPFPDFGAVEGAARTSNSIAFQ